MSVDATSIAHQYLHRRMILIQSIYHRQVVRTRENLPIGKTATLALKSKGNNLSCTWQNSFTKHLWVENNTKKRVKMEKVESC